jgi:Tfp pilus assembly protein PilV
MNRKRSKAGFSLVETVVATMVLSVGVLCVVNLTRWSFQAMYETERATLATQLSQSKLDENRGKNLFDSLTSGRDTTNGITRTWTVTPVETALKQVVVVVQWTALPGHSRSITNVTYVRRP